MQLTLKKLVGDDLQEVVYQPPFVSARHHRKLLEFESEIDYSDMGLEETDKLVNFVCDVYGNQFTSDEFYDGVASHELVNTITSVFYFVRTGQAPAVNKEGNDQGKS